MTILIDVAIMNQITQILNFIEQRNPQATEQLLPLVYDELRKLAGQKLRHEKAGQTLQATALVHEAYLRLVDDKRPHSWDSRRHFFAAAAEAMRRILIERARRKSSRKGHADFERVDLDELASIGDQPCEELLALDDALNKLAKEDPAKAELVQLRYFGGLSLKDAAEALGISRATASRHWSYVKVWLHCEIKKDKPEKES